jgi:hypothetical protein
MRRTGNYNKECSDLHIAPIPNPSPARACRQRPADSCSKEEPVMREVMPGHHVACHLREAQTAAFAQARSSFGGAGFR